MPRSLQLSNQTLQVQCGQVGVFEEVDVAVIRNSAAYKPTANLNNSSIFVHTTNDCIIMETQNIISLFKSNNGFLYRSQLTNRVMYGALLQLVKEGKVDRIKNGIYFMEGASRKGEVTHIGRLVSGGVLCMYSAWFHYELSVQVPQSYHIAIEKSRKVTLPEYPLIELYYWQKNYQGLGISTFKTAQLEVQIYDIHKCVCDAVKFRNKIGMETTIEILKNYIKRKDRNLVKLMEYGRMMRIERILKTYLEVQL